MQQFHLITTTTSGLMVLEWEKTLKKQIWTERPGDKGAHIVAEVIWFREMIRMCGCLFQCRKLVHFVIRSHRFKTIYQLSHCFDTLCVKIETLTVFCNLFFPHVLPHLIFKIIKYVLTFKSGLYSVFIS